MNVTANLSFSQQCILRTSLLDAGRHNCEIGLKYGVEDDGNAYCAKRAVAHSTFSLRGQLIWWPQLKQRAYAYQWLNTEQFVLLRLTGGSFVLSLDTRTI